MRFMVSRFIDTGRIVIKETNLSYHLEKVFDHDIPALQHGNDGLIYTRVSTHYTTGTDKHMCVYFQSPSKPPLSSCDLVTHT